MRHSLFLKVFAGCKGAFFKKLPYWGSGQRPDFSALSSDVGEAVEIHRETVVENMSDVRKTEDVRHGVALSGVAPVVEVEAGHAGRRDGEGAPEQVRRNAEHEGHPRHGEALMAEQRYSFVVRLCKSINRAIFFISQLFQKPVHKKKPVA